MLKLKANVMWTLTVVEANAVQLTATVAQDQIIADQASFPIRMMATAMFSRLKRLLITKLFFKGCVLDDVEIIGVDINAERLTVDFDDDCARACEDDALCQ